MKTLLLIAALLAPELVLPQVRTGVVTGQLRSANGQSAAGIRISAMAVPEPGIPPSSASTLVSFVLSDATGHYRLENVPTGRYYITAGFIDMPTYYPGVSALTGATVVSVAAGATVSGIDFPIVVPAGVTVKGRLIGQGNQPPPPGVNRIVTLYGATAFREQNVVGADGSFEFSRVRAGTYTLMTNFGTLAEPNIVVSDRDITDIEAVVVAMVVVLGTVVVENDGVLPRFVVSFSAFKGGAMAAPVASVGPNGTFRTSLPEGVYRIGWSGLPAGYEVKSVAAGSSDLLANSLNATPVGAPPAIRVSLGVSSPPPWGKVSGRVIGLTGFQQGSGRLTLVGTSVPSTLDAPINPDGSFEFARVLPGTYTARVTAPNLTLASSSIRVPNNKGLSGVEITLPPLREVSGQVIIEGSSQTVPRLNFVVGELGGVIPAAAAVAQTDGTFKVTLPEGERRLTLTVPGYILRSLNYGSTDLLRDPLKLTAKDSAQLRVTLAPASVAGGVPGGVIGGVLGGVLGGIIAPPPSPPPPPLPAPSPGTRIGGDVAQANLISNVPPKYPELARTARVQGVVILNVTISKEGAVENATVVSGHALLNEAAIEAVRQWRYRPQVINGQPVQVQTTVTVNFSFQ